MHSYQLYMSATHSLGVPLRGDMLNNSVAYPFLLKHLTHYSTASKIIVLGLSPPWTKLICAA